MLFSEDKTNNSAAYVTESVTEYLTAKSKNRQKITHCRRVKPLNAKSKLNPNYCTLKLIQYDHVYN